MADEQLIKPRELPAATTVFADDAIMTDDGVTVGKATPVQIVNAGAPVPTEAEAIAGADNSKRMTPLTVKQVLDSVTAPSVLRAAAWAESASAPDPSIPGSKSAKSWADEAGRLGAEQADRAEAAAQIAEDVIGGPGALQVFVDEAAGWTGEAEGFADAAEAAAEAAALSAGRVDLGALDDAVTATAADREQTSLDRTAAAAQAAQAAIEKAEAEAARIAAEAARDANWDAGVIKYWPADAAALAAITGMIAGDLAFRRSPTPEHIFRYNGTTWEDQGEAPSASKVNVNYLSARLDDEKIFGMALPFRDGSGAVAGAVLDDGRLYFYETASEKLVARQSVELPGGYEVTDEGTLHGSVTDAAGNVVSGYGPDGTFYLGSLQVQEINGKPANSIGGSTGRNGGTFLTDWVGIICTGQSLGEGATPATSITTSQEYDNFGLPARAADYSSATILPLTVANCGVTGRGENPMFGTAGAIKALMSAENGLSPSDLLYRPVAVNTAYSGYKIAQLKKGTDPYQDGIDAMARAKDLADGAGVSFAVGAVTWTQGEGDGVTPTDYATYRDALIQLAKDYDADLRSVTGQSQPVHLITYQTGTRHRSIGRAQLEAMQRCPLIVMAAPIYQMTYGDALHINAASSKWLGGYYGLAYKRTVIDGQKWEPLMPVASEVHGSVIDLCFNKSGLLFDTSTLPAQVNYGFSVLNGSGVAQTISSIEIVQPSRVRITVSGAPAPGWKVCYGEADMVGRGDAYEGGGGNLRDSAGDILKYNGNRLDNWAILFNWIL